jgi:DNA-binding transcriptional ArsR family regulator
MAVGQIAERLPVTRPAVSQHLKVLKEAGLVTDQAIGTRRIYRVRSDGLQAIHAYLDQMWGQALAGFQAAAEQLAAQQAAAQQAVHKDRQEQS